MEPGAPSRQTVLQLRVVLRHISPLIWRRLLVFSDTTIAQLHQVLQAAFGWEDAHLHRFEIRGREYGLYRDWGVFFDTDAHRIFIGDLNLRRLERFTYEYDFGDSWMHDLRIEATLPVDPGLAYPLCAEGRGAGPPEDCGGAQVFMANRSLYALIGGGDSHAQLDDLVDDMDDEEWAILGRYHPDRFDRRAINSRLVALSPCREAGEVSR